MKRASPPQLQRVIQKLGYLIDLTRIIDRNTEDGAFWNQGGTIHYVFDTNVVQMFFEPFRNPQFCEVFFGSIWQDKTSRHDEINAQGCLIAAEYLFSGFLPGQRDDGRWYMSALHREELDIQIEYLCSDIKLVDETLASNPRFRNESARLLQQLNSALAFDDTGPDHLFNLASRGGMPQAQLQALVDLPPSEFERRALEIRSREVGRALALDSVLEPRWQLDRFQNEPEMLGARRDLENLLHVNERNPEIFREALGWQNALSSVLARRGGGVRSETAIRADCETLALISWGSREVLPPDERIVFVTGDRALLEAYKQRHVDEPQSGPFLLRPIVHFAPLFNPSSARSNLDSKNYAFQALREALEGAMLALNLGLFNYEQPHGKLRARDHFSSKVERELDDAASLLVKFFPAFSDSHWLTKQEQRLQSLVKDLRPIEKLMLEAYPRLVAARLQERQDEFIATFESAGDAVDKAIVMQLRDAKRAGMRFSLPLMNEAVRELLDRIARRKNDARVRALIPLKLSFASAPGEYIFYAEEIARLQFATGEELDKLLTELMGTPPRIFALAAMLAFILERWKDAARYAALAANASGTSARVRPSARAVEDHNELSYLNAVSLRFRLSAWDPLRASGYGDPLREWHLSAREELNRCEAFYNDKGYLSREVRTISERASLQVSYCEWLIFGPSMLAERYDEPDKHCFAALAEVVLDLVSCDRLIEPALSRAEEEEQIGRKGSLLVLRTASLQFRLNVLGASLAGEALVKRWPHLEPDVSRLISQLPEPQEIEWEEKPHLAEAYLAAYDGDLESLDAIKLDDVTLALDRAIIRGLQSLVRERKPTP